MKKRKKEKLPNQHASSVADGVDVLAHAIVASMSPLEIGMMIQPDGQAVALSDVPVVVRTEYATRYTQKELASGQFFKVGNNYTFFMSHDAKKSRQH